MAGTLSKEAQGKTKPANIDCVEQPKSDLYHWHLRNRLGHSRFIRVTDELFNELELHNQNNEETPQQFMLGIPEEAMSIEEELWRLWERHLIFMTRTQENVHDIIGLGFRSLDDTDHIFILRKLLSDLRNAVETILALKGQLSLPLSEESEW